VMVDVSAPMGGEERCGAIGRGSVIVAIILRG